MAEIRITLPEVSSIAMSLRNHNQSLDETLSYIAKTMNSMNASWQSESSEEIVANFNLFARSFIDESETIEEYARFLDNIVSTYDSMESTLSANAQNFVK